MTIHAKDLLSPPSPQIEITYSVGDELGSSARNGALLDDDGALASVLGDDASDSLKGSHVSGAASTDTTVLCGGVDGDEDNVSLADAASDVGAEEQVGRTLGQGRLLASAGVEADGSGSAAITGNTDDVVQTRLVDGRVLGVPAADSGLVSVDNGDLDVRVLVGNHGRGGTTY